MKCNVLTLFTGPSQIDVAKKAIGKLINRWRPNLILKNLFEFSK